MRVFVNSDDISLKKIYFGDTWHIWNAGVFYATLK